MSSHVRRVLIAEKYDIVRTGVRSLLDSRPTLQIVAEASDGRTALEQARATNPHIVIADYALPRLNGVDLTRALKRELPRAEVLIFTAQDCEETVLDLLRAGARGYVLKSDSERHLLAAIDALSIHRPYFSGGISETLIGRCLESAPTTQTTLTRREREVVQLIAQGQLSKEVAHSLEIGVKTVETHRSAIMHKLKIHNTAQLVRYALRNNMIEA